MGPDLDPAFDQGADPHQSNADLDPALYFTADQDPEPVPLLSDGLMGICDHCLQTLQASILSLQVSIVGVHASKASEF
jgi:hypothetical protein